VGILRGLIALVVLSFTFGCAPSGATAHPSQIATRVPAHATSSPTPTVLASRRVLIAQTYQVDNPAYKAKRVGMSGDGVWEIGHVVWSSWTTTRAIGRGVSYEHNCLPSCSKGIPHHYPIEMTWTHPRRFCGRWYFTRLKRVFPGRRSHNPNFKQSLTINFTDLIAASQCHLSGPVPY
jgi:hypothetical protein